MKSLKTILTAMLTLILALSAVGCGTKTPSPQTGILATTTDEQLIAKYIEGLDICLVGEAELLFTSAATIPSQTLYMFFVYATLQDKLYTPNDWLSKTDGKYHIPASAVAATVAKYFNGAKLEPSSVHDYVASANEYVTTTFGGFGGGRFVQLRSKEAVSADTIKLTADFYTAADHKTIAYTKVYTIQVGSDGHKYLSIAKR